MTIDMKKTTRDNIFYLMIALAFLGILGLVAWYQEAHGLSIRMPISTKQFAVVFTTVGIFGYAIREWQRAWRRVKFWTVLSILLAVYVPLQWLLVRHINVNIFTFVIVGVVELFTLLFVLEKLLPPEYHRAK
jgi:hypothetical protein